MGRLLHATVGSVDLPGQVHGRTLAELVRPTDGVSRLLSATPTGWDAAFESRSQAQMDAWFAANTGYQSGGFPGGSLTNLGGIQTVTPQWLSANQDGNRIYQSGGRWFIERIQCSGLRIAASNVTVRWCHLGPTANVASGSGGDYGITMWGTTAFDSSATGVLIEHCTIGRGGLSPSIGLMLRTFGSGGASAVQVRNCRVRDFRVGFHHRENTTVEYCYVTNLYYFSDRHGITGPSHNTSGSINPHGSNIVIRRNNYDDGNSSALSVYANQPMSNILIEENLWNTPSANYLLNIPGDKPHVGSISNMRILGNQFGRKYNSTGGTSGNYSAAHNKHGNGNQWSGNQVFPTGAAVS